MMMELENGRDAPAGRYLQGGGEQGVFGLPVPISVEGFHGVRRQQHANDQPGNLLQLPTTRRFGDEIRGQLHTVAVSDAVDA